MNLRSSRRGFLLGGAATGLLSGPAAANLPLLGAGAPGGAGALAAPFASVNGLGGPDDYLNGWSAQYTSTPPALAPDSSPTQFTVLRQGYDGTAAAVTFRDTYTVTQRVRQAYPNQGSPSALTVALSDYVYATDTVDGAVVNGSTLTSPTPVCNWVMPDRTTVGSALYLELVAFHRDARRGRQVAAVKFIASDGVNAPVTQIVSTPAISTGQAWGALDQHPVIVYACALDISSLNDNALITVNAEVYPWVGGAGSVAKSASSVNRREFSPRYFYKNTSLAGAPCYAYVQATGNDSTAVASTNATIAAASPFQTVTAAIAKIASVAGKLDNGIVRVGAGTFTLNANAVAQSQACGLFTVTRDPATTASQSQAVVTCGTNSFRPKITGGFLSGVSTGCVRFQDITVQRDGTAGTFTGESANRLEVQFVNVTFDQNAKSAQWLSAADDSFFGANILNVATTGLNATSASQHRMYRGVTVDMGAGYAGMERWCVIGCTISRPGTFGTGVAGGFSGSILAFCRLNDPVSNGNFCDNIGASSDVNGAVLAQNVFEWISTGTGACLGISSDNTTGNNTHIIVHHNVFTGWQGSGRANIFYDDGAYPASRKSLLQSVKGNIFSQLNTKGDVFVAINDADPTDAPNKLGNWSFLYGVGCQGNFSQFVDAAGGGLGDVAAQAYPGLGCNIGTSSTVRNDPLFTNYQGTQSASVAGAGSGTYTLQGGSPCRQMVASAVLPFDLAGAARAVTKDTAGAYA